MKKVTLVVGILLGLVALGLSAGKALALPSCSDGIQQFSYGFLCPHNPNDTNAAPWSGNYNPGYVPTGSTIHFGGGYIASGPPRGSQGTTAGAEVLVWVTIDGDQSLISGAGVNGAPATSVSGIANPGGTSGVASDNCPGLNNSQFGPVYNYRDKNGPYDQPGGNGPDASPAAYDPTDPAHQGLEDCQSNGKMVYWKNAVESRGYGFDLNLAKGRTGTLCVRENISVRFGNDTGYFPGPEFGQNRSPHQEDVVAAHVAKQSQKLCFDIGNQPPTGGNTPNGGLAIDCNTGNYTVSAYDPDSPNSGINYEIIHGNPAGGFTVDATGTTSRNGSTGHFNLTLNRTYILKAFDLNDGQPYTVASQAFGGSCGNPPPRNNQACYTYDHGLQDHSIYRITAYSRIGNYIVSSPNPTTRSSKGPWSNLGPGANYQSGEINTNGGYADGAGGSFDNGSGNFHLNFPAPTGPDRYVLLENWHHNPDGSWTYTTGSDSVPNCWSATCSISIDSNVPGNPPNGVQGGGVFTVRTYVTNTGSEVLPPSMFGNSLTMTGAGGNQPYFPQGVPLTDVGQTIQPGATATVDPFGLTAPNNVGSYTLGAYPDYYGRFALGPPCYVFGGANAGGGGGPCSGVCGVDVYQTFQITAHASIDADPENLFSLNLPNGGFLPYSTGGVHNGADIDTTDRSWLSYIPLGGGEGTVDGVHVTPRTYGNPPDEHFQYRPIPPPPANPGDQWCANVIIDDGSGWVGPNGARVNNGPSTARDCKTVTNEPYVHFMESDAQAGGGFGNNCVSNPAGISTFTSTTGTRPVGSGVQLGALSIGPIQGFNSANLRGTPPTGSTGLSFANDSSHISGGPPAGQLGGSLGGTHCITDYFGTKPAGTPTSNSNHIGLTGFAGKSTQYYVPSGGTLKIDPSVISDGTELTIYVKGNVEIDGDITYLNDNWPSLDAIPSVYIIAEGDSGSHHGNIYVNPAATRLDGIYVAQPDNSNGSGSIYSCANGTSQVPVGELLATCNSQLLVNGSFVAEHVYLDRAKGSMRYSHPGEHLSPPNLAICGNTPADQSFLGDCAAEIFNFSPELLVAQPDTTASSGPTTGKYEYITSLSPVL